MVDRMVKFSFLFVILVNFRVPVLGIDMNDLEKDAEGSLEALDNILSSFQGDEACEFKCPNEGEVKKPRPGHKPTSNGCGSFGIKLETSSLPEMTRCCDVHDFCYDTCGKVRADCDDQFQLCLYEMCEAKKTTFTTDQYEGCFSTIKLMLTGVRTMGCPAYKAAQKKSCVCKVAPKEDKTIDEDENEEQEQEDDPYEDTFAPYEEENDEEWGNEDAHYNPFGNVPELPPLFKEGEVDPFDGLAEQMAEFRSSSKIWLDDKEFDKTLKDSKVTDRLKATADVLRDAMEKSKTIGKAAEKSREEVVTKIKAAKKVVSPQGEL